MPGNLPVRISANVCRARLNCSLVGFNSGITAHTVAGYASSSAGVNTKTCTGTPAGLPASSVIPPTSCFWVNWPSSSATCRSVDLISPTSARSTECSVTMIFWSLGPVTTPASPSQARYHRQGLSRSWDPSRAPPLPSTGQSARHAIAELASPYWRSPP